MLRVESIPEEFTDLESQTPTTLIPKPTNRVATYSKNAAKFALGLAGLGSIALYITPASNCAKLETCGLWLSQLTNEKAATVVFTLGGIDYAGICFLQGLRSFDRTVEFIKAQKSNTAKAGKGTFVVLFALSQNVPMFFTSQGTNAPLWQTAVAVGGSLSSSLFGTINMVDHDLHLLLTKSKQITIVPYRAIVDLFSPLSDQEKWRRQQLAHYTKQHALFIQHLEEKFRGVVANASTLDVDSHMDPLTFLFQQQAQPETKLEYVMHKIGQVISPFVAANFLAGLISNSFHTIQKMVPIPFFQVLLTAFFSISNINGSLKITTSAITGPIDTLINLLTKKPIQSLSFQLRPKTTTIALIVSALASALSYALIEIIFEKQFPGEDVGLRKGLRIGAATSVDIYHMAGLFHLYQLCFSLLTRTDKEKFLFNLHNREIPNWKTKSLEDFIEFVENNDAARNELLNLEPFTDAHIHEIREVSTTAPQSRWGFFSKKAVKPQLETEPLLGLSYQPT